MSIISPPIQRLSPQQTTHIEQFAQSLKVDERIENLVPGFDVPFFQAGLAGYSDAAMRLVARQHGCPFCVTEALLDIILVNGGKGRVREDPDLLAAECGSGDPMENQAAGLDDHPIAGQVIGATPQEMAAGAVILVGMNYDVIDVNLACPVKKMRKRNRGGHLLAAPEEAIAILKAVRATVPDNLPTTVKMRRSFDDSPEMAANFEEIFNAAYEIGYSWVTVHCRTVEQKYHGPGKWDFLRDLVSRHKDKLIFGSGDIFQAHDIFSMIDNTGVQAVSVARGCIGNPWIFRQARQLMAGQEPIAPTIPEQRTALLHHFDFSVKLHGEQAASRMMRKFGIKFSAHHPNGDEVKAQFVRCRTVADWRAVIEEYYQADC